MRPARSSGWTSRLGAGILSARGTPHTRRSGARRRVHGLGAVRWRVHGLAAVRRRVPGRGTVRQRMYGRGGAAGLGRERPKRALRFGSAPQAGSATQPRRAMRSRCAPHTGRTPWPALVPRLRSAARSGRTAQPTRAPWPRAVRDRGASAIEFAGMLPLLLLVAMAAIQLGIVGYAVQQAGSGARAAARVAAQEDIAGEYAAGGRAAMSGWTAGRSSFALGGADEEVKVTATVTIPSIVPGIGSFGSASRSVTMPRD